MAGRIFGKTSRKGMNGVECFGESGEAEAEKRAWEWIGWERRGWTGREGEHRSGMDWMGTEREERNGEDWQERIMASVKDWIGWGRTGRKETERRALERNGSEKSRLAGEHRNSWERNGRNRYGTDSQKRSGEAGKERGV